MSESAWKWGAYRRGMGKEGDDPRIIYATSAIKRELYFNGFGDDKINLDTSVFGKQTEKAVRQFQRSIGMPRPRDAMVGPKTANALFKYQIETAQVALGIPDNWLRAQIHWESADDPGAQFTNPDGSRDRGLIQLNSRNNDNDDQVFDPSWAISFLARFQQAGHTEFKDCDDIDPWRLAIGRWRTPVGAADWCNDPNTQPNQDGTWAEKATFYVGRVDTWGRLGWVG